MQYAKPDHAIMKFFSTNLHIYGLVQKRHNSSV